ncbi:proline--tRNA ligase [Thermoflavifilum thermophilum]|uniref:Proline--tRNA ligase n=1 Tax=Thermoflavifilum thermophilum TaxID=1393122 RepID=A0A1I7NEV3_9BACT|nr:proline--tRNA ligase [Thermoflavifilum thermophilum]SFV33202.1 prolyl-tRNA synthetase [Thermoflavifilum thermophilum]
MSKAITPRAQDYAQWYNDLVIKSGLADYSAVRGCMVIKPYGYALWENMQAELDKMFKDTGHQNAYFPLFIPKTFLSREAAHVEGFAKECAVVTHYRLKNDPAGGGVIVDPEAALEEELIVRPTSETIIWNTYKTWIQSYRDLPILINQWANVVRWEMRTRLFLRTAEFLWQEGHTAHATAEEAMEEARRMLDVYTQFAESFMALPVIRGVKSPAERFAGAVETFCIEALMQDGKALQAGTSHFLGQNFARAFDVQFLNKNNEQEYVWATSWGVSTRLIGALVMAHGDDDGLKLPPKLAPIQVIIIPVYKNDTQRATVHTQALEILEQLKKAGFRVQYDDADHVRPGWKYAEYELRGVPLRLSLGEREIQQHQVEAVRRDTREKLYLPFDQLPEKIGDLLDQIQQDMFHQAKSFRDQHITTVDNWDDFLRALEEPGGFVYAHWDGTPETEIRIKELSKATIRCIPFPGQLPDHGSGHCVLTGKPSARRVLFARAY